MAYPGVFMLDDASIFKAMLRTGKNGGTICMHAENGGVIDVLVKKALAEGKTAPKYHALTRPARAEAEATHRAIALAEIADVPIYIVHLSAAEALEMVTEARDRGLAGVSRRRARSICSSPTTTTKSPASTASKYVMSPPLRPKETQDRAVARARVQRSAGHRHRSLPVLHERAEDARRTATSRRSRTAHPASRRA